MKLAQKYNRANMFTSLIILALSGAVYYFAIHYILTNRLDNDLDIEEQEIIAYADKYSRLPSPEDYKDQQVTFRLLEQGAAEERYHLDTDYYNSEEEETEPGRSLITVIQTGGHKYIVTITKSSLEAEDLIRLIFMITLGVFIILLVSLIVINRLVLSRLWSPFYDMLKQLKMFNLADNREFSIPSTQIEEFQELNQSVLSMTQRVKKDYTELKSFTDNASHEMMTPLAVINSKLDTLIQTEILSDQQGELIADVYLAVSRLSRLNQSLLLMTKIENNLIRDEESIELSTMISQKIRQFNELLQDHEIEVTQQLVPHQIMMNKHLADILLNNLISNAIRHNHRQGRIIIKLSANTLSVANTGAEKPLDEQRAFKRFYKDIASEGTGLGLAITSQICNYYQLQLKYGYTTDQHIFTISF